MERQEFRKYRRELNRTQEAMSRLLGVSVKAVRSYEQGWRQIPPHVERQVLFLASIREDYPEARTPCWIVNTCPEERKVNCPAWEFKAGDLCWFVNGTFCMGVAQPGWKEKMGICRGCKAFPSSLRNRDKP